MGAPWQAAAALARREWSGTLRQPAEWLTPLAFVVGVSLMFPLGLGPEPARLRELAPGLLCAYFSDRGRLFQPDRGRQNGVAEAAPGRRAGTGLTVAESSTISLKRPWVVRLSGLVLNPS